MKTYQDVKASVEGWYASLYGYTSKIIPPNGDENVPSWVETLWKDSRDWRIRSFDDRMTYFDPFEFWRDARKLERGDHWTVWGRRNVGDEDKWKQELIDDEISNQVRVRKSYLTANWHDLSIVPNIKDINLIVDSERLKTKWGDFITQFVHRGLVEGMAIAKTILDRTIDPDGIAKEILLDNAGIFPTPYSYGIEKLEGTWYMIHAELESIQQIKEEFPHADDLNFDQIQEEIARYLRLDLDTTTPKRFLNTQLVPVLRLYMDDPKTVRAGHDQEEIDTEHEALKNGVPFDATETQNHAAHVEQHLKFLEDLHALEPEDQLHTDLRDHQTEYMALHIEDHHKWVQKKRLLGLSAGVYQKYPDGRMITVAGGVVLQDEPNPFGKDWRKLFHIWQCEKLPDSWWGRGVPEILWNTNKVEDTMLSRTADIAISVGIPKEYFKLIDKDNVEEQGLDNDPLKPRFVTEPPVFRKGESPRENMEIYQAMKANAGKAQAISGLSYGQSPSSGASGKLVQELLSQNSVMITGEANQRLNDTVERMMQMRIHFYRQFYTEPRWYYLHGKAQAINLSEMLTKFPVVNPETGQTEQREIPMFEVTVRPNSNFPMRFEQQLAFLLELSRSPSPDGTPYVTREAILDVLQNIYPQLGVDGPYYKMAQALAIGMQEMAKMEEKQKQDMQTAKTFRGKLLNKGMKEVTGDGAMNKQEEVLSGASQGGTGAASPGAGPANTAGNA